MSVRQAPGRNTHKTVTESYWYIFLSEFEKIFPSIK